MPACFEGITGEWLGLPRPGMRSRQAYVRMTSVCSFCTYRYLRMEQFWMDGGKSPVRWLPYLVARAVRGAGTKGGVLTPRQEEQSHAPLVVVIRCASVAASACAHARMHMHTRMHAYASSQRRAVARGSAHMSQCSIRERPAKTSGIVPESEFSCKSMWLSTCIRPISGGIVPDRRLWPARHVYTLPSLPI